MNKKVVLSVLSATVVASMAASAFAAPKSGLYIGGNVDKFYSFDTLFDITPGALTQFTNEIGLSDFNNLIYVDFDGKGASLQEIMAATDFNSVKKDLTSDKFEGEYSLVKPDGTSSEKYDPRKDSIDTPAGELKVESVSAINASQIQVTFGKAVQSGIGTYGAQNIANYALTGATLNSVDLSDDGKVATLNITALKTATPVAVTVKPVADADDATKKTALFTTTVTVDDKAAPTVTDVVAKTNGATASSVKITFSEPVQAGATFKIDGAVVTSPSYNTNKTEVTFSGLSLAAGTTHTLEVIGLLDTADNATNPNPLTKTFSISVDATLPTISTVEAYGDKAILLTFSKKMNASTVNTTNIKIKDEKLDAVTAGTIVPLSTDTTGTKFVLPVDSSVTLYSATTTSRNLTVLVTDAVQDELGNKVATSTKSVTLNKDVTAPAVASVSYLNDGSGKLASVTVEFNEALKAGTYTLSSSNLTVIDKDGVDVTSTFTNYLDAATVSAGGKKLVFNKKSPVTATAFYNQYTFTFKAGLAQDAAETANNSAAYTKVIDFGAQPSGDFVLTGTPATYNASTRVITVAYGRAVKGGAVAGSATDVNNYTLNGAPLAAGTTITLKSDKTEAYITLPAGSIAANDSAAVFRISGVQDANGVTITPFVQTLSVKDNTAPTLQSARVLDNKTVELTFSENLAAASNANVGDEFVIFEGTTAKVLTASELKANSVAGFAKKLTLTVSKGTDAPASVGTVTASKTGTTGSLTGTYTGTADKSYTVTVKTVDGTSGEATVVTVDGVDINETAAGNHTFNIGNGLTINISKGTGTLAANDTFTFNATAATFATTLDLTKDLSIKTVAPSSGVDVKDLENNGQTGDLTVVISK